MRTWYREGLPHLGQHYDHGRAAARRELESGHPGYFYCCGPGSYVSAVDRETGLPVCLYGDAIDPRNANWVDGFNAGVEEHIREHGLPWNSRKAWLPLLEDIPNFETRLPDHPPNVLSPLAPPAHSPDKSCRLELGEEVLGAGERGQVIRLTSTNVFLGEFAGPYRLGTQTASEAWRATSPPKLGSGVKKAWLNLAGVARAIDFHWGPENSHLAFFRFRDLALTSQSIYTSFELYRQGGEHVAALDLQLAAWLPPLQPQL